MDKLVDKMKKLKIETKVDKLPPPLRCCKKCLYNIGSDENGLCATCDPNHRWWKNAEKQITEVQED